MKNSGWIAAALATLALLTPNSLANVTATATANATVAAPRTTATNATGFNATAPFTNRAANTTTTITAAAANMLHANMMVNTTMPAEGKRFVGYFIAWGTYARDYTPDKIPLDSVTHLNYAFAKIADNGTIVTGDIWADVQKSYDNQDDANDTTNQDDQPYQGAFWQINRVLKKRKPSLRTLISIGGWSGSGLFSDVAATEESRQTFTDSVVEFVKKYDFDGADIDWEHPVEGKPHTPTAC